MAGVIRFCVRSYTDVVTNQVSDPNNPVHSGTVYQIKFNPSFILTNGNNPDLLNFVSHFRYWKWSGTKIVTLPLARVGVDPAHVIADNGPVGSIDPFDMSLFHSYKLDNWGPQSVPLTPTGQATDDASFLMDMSWKKCSILKPWSLFVKPRGYQVMYSRPEHTTILDLTQRFDPNALRATTVDPLYEVQSVIPKEPQMPIPDETTVGHVVNDDIIMRTAPGQGSEIDGYPIYSQDTSFNRGYDTAVVHNHTHNMLGFTPLMRGILLRAHSHNVPIQQMAEEELRFNYGDEEEEGAPNPHPEFIPPGFGFSGRSRYAGGWWNTRTWYVQGSSTGVSGLQAFEYPGFLWRVPNHLRTKLYFRQWFFHYFALKSPITHVVMNPYTLQYEPRDMKFDNAVWSQSPDGANVLGDVEYRAYYSSVNPSDEADLKDVPITAGNPSP